MSLSVVFFVLLVIAVDYGVSQESTDQRLSNSSIQFYDIAKEQDLGRAKSWYEMVDRVRSRLGSNQERDMQALEQEACVLKNASMCYDFRSARQRNKTVPGLTTAECLVVTMYTGSFYWHYNADSANGTWEPYLIYTHLLLSAVKKLSAIDPIRSDEVLYRGLRGTFTAPRAKQIYWKTFTSASLSLTVASGFGPKTLLKFQAPATRYGARVRNLSYFPSEEEVLLLPFESFDFLHVDQNGTFVFRASDIQELLDPKKEVTQSIAVGNSAVFPTMGGLLLLQFCMMYAV